MRFSDTLRFARDAAAGYPLRTALSVLAMAIGVASQAPEGRGAPTTATPGAPFHAPSGPAET